MNKLDDFLKNKLDDSGIEAPSGWDALSKALPVKRTGKTVTVWAVSALVISVFVTSLVMFNREKPINPPSTGVNSVPVESKEAASKSTSYQLVEAGNGTSDKTVAIPLSYNQASRNQSYSVPVPEAQSNPVVVSNSATQNQPDKSVAVAQNDVTVKAENTTHEAEKQVAETPSKTDKNQISVAKPTVKVKVKTKNDFHKGKFYASASLAVVGSYRSYQLNNGAAPYVNKLYDNLRQNSEEAAVSNAVSIALEYRFLKNFSLEGGIGFNKTGYNSNYDFEINDKATTDPVTGRITGYDNLATPQQIISAGKTNINVVRIPVGINYNLLFNSNSLFHIYVGGAQNILLSANGTTLDQLTLQQKPLSKADFVNTARELCVDLGVNFALASNYGIGVDLFYNKWITDISRNRYENISPFSGGINISLSRKIF